MILTYEGKTPKIAANVFIAPTAVVIGAVDIQEGASIRYGAVLRSDIAAITVGRNTNIQEIGPGELAAGMPATAKRRLTEADKGLVLGAAAVYRELAARHAALTGPPDPTGR